MPAAMRQGVKFTPLWMDWPMLFEGNACLMRHGMALFCHMMPVDSATVLGAIDIPDLDLILR
jgi:hypothetical protein